MAIDRETQRQVKQTVERWNKWLKHLGGAVSLEDAIAYHERAAQQDELQEDVKNAKRKRRK